MNPKDAIKEDLKKFWKKTESLIKKEVDGRLSLNGGTISGAVEFDDVIRGKAPIGTLASGIIILPYVPYNLIDPTHEDKTYYKELLKWICAHYPNKQGALFIGSANPNTAHQAFIRIYNTDEKDANGYPRYASGMCTSLGGIVETFGTNNYVYFFRLCYNDINPQKNISESGITWGGANFSGTYGCIDAAMIPTLGANRLAFIKGDASKIEYSRDSGSTWTDYTTDANEKAGLFGEQGYAFSIGKADANNKATAAYMLRVTIDTDKANVYTKLNKFALYISSSGSKGCYCTIDASLESTPDTWVTFANKVAISGWSGWNIINTTDITTYGNTAAAQYGLLRFTFGCGAGSAEYSGLQVMKIMGFDGVGWNTPSNMAKYGTVYGTDNYQNVTFPRNVSANNFTGKFNGHTVNSDVPANAKFTDTTYGLFQRGTSAKDPVNGLVPGPMNDTTDRAFLTPVGWEEFDFHTRCLADSVVIGQMWSDEYMDMFTIPGATQEKSGALTAPDKKKLDEIDMDAIKEELKSYIDKTTSFNIDKVYPVGSIYTSVNDTDPSTLFGGTWVRFSQGRMLVGVNSADTDFNAAEKTGGEKTHVLDFDEMPNHNHRITVDNKELTGSVWNFTGQNASYGPGNSVSGVFTKGGDGTCFYPSATGKATGINDGFTMDASHTHTATASYEGGGEAHNNMPPYITVYMWKRTK